MKQQQIQTRAEIADELMRNCPSETLEDHEAIADAICGGVSLTDLLEMPEVNRWPETCLWLINQFKTIDAD